MPLSGEQSMALVGRRVRIADPPPERPELLDKTGVVAMITDRTNCVILLEEDGSGVTLNADQLELAS